MSIRYFLRTGRFSYLLNLRTQNIVGKNADSFYQENESLAKLSLVALLSQSPPVAKLSQKTEKVVKKHLILFSSVSTILSSNQNSVCCEVRISEKKNKQKSRNSTNCIKNCEEHKKLIISD